MSDAVTMAGRCLRLSRRNNEALITSLALPVMLMLLFVELFGGAIDTGTKYVTYVVPGVLLLCAGFGSSLTAVSVSHDMTGGIVDRLRSLDVGGAALLAGHVAASAARNVASSVLVFGVAIAIGFRPNAAPLEWLAVAGVLLAFILAMSSLAAAIGLLATSPEGANGLTFFLMFLPYSVPAPGRRSRGAPGSCSSASRWRGGGSAAGRASDTPASSGTRAACDRSCAVRGR